MTGFKIMTLQRVSFMIVSRDGLIMLIAFVSYMGVTVSVRHLVDQVWETERDGRKLVRWDGTDVRWLGMDAWGHYNWLLQHQLILKSSISYEYSEEAVVCFSILLLCHWSREINQIIQFSMDDSWFQCYAQPYYVKGIVMLMDGAFDMFKRLKDSITFKICCWGICCIICMKIIVANNARSSYCCCYLDNGNSNSIII